MNLTQAIEIRKYLHKNPELSGLESKTASFVLEIIKKLNPDKIISNIGGNGFAAIFFGNQPKLNIAFRAELDALPIKEINDFDYKSTNNGVSHKCGHDGHMTNLIYFASKIADIKKTLQNNIIILFQPAEETAQGAKAMINDPKFDELKIDYIFGLHNLPGYPLGNVILNRNVFASASTGLIVELNGKTSHAAHPENGNNPVLAMTGIIHGLLSVPSLHTKLQDSANITVIHSRLGEVAFGTSPGEAVVMATLRSHKNDVMDIMKNESVKLAENIANAYGLEFKFKWVEDFSATFNFEETFEAIKSAISNLDIKTINKDIPFPWSEDFGFFSQKAKTGFFGIGSGENHPQLHNPDYDYPDDLIAISSNIFLEIVQYFER